jgi:hypothetical protein
MTKAVSLAQYRQALRRPAPRTVYVYQTGRDQYSVDFYGGKNHRCMKYIKARRYWLSRLTDYYMVSAGKGYYTEA